MYVGKRGGRRGGGIEVMTLAVIWGGGGGFEVVGCRVGMPRYGLVRF